MAINILIRIGIIIFSSLAIPYLIKLLYGIRTRIYVNKHPDKLTAIVLLFLFSTLLVISIVSIVVSTCSFIGVKPTIINQISNIRSLFLSITNFISSVIFYKIYLDGEKPKRKGK